MKLLTKENREQLLRNGRAQRERQDSDPDAPGTDFRPVVKLFTPDAGATWLLTELDPDDEDRAFGLCDLGLGCPELGYVSLAEIASVRGNLNLSIERDLHFTPSKTLSAYADEARAAGYIKA